MRAWIYCVKLIFLISSVESQTEDCDCYILGTKGSIDGQSICNQKTLQCKCYPNVQGKTCNECVHGYYNILSGRGCSACHCNSLGSNDSICDKITGQCSCKPGYIGLQCDRCEGNSYESSYRGCVKCDCNFYGSHNQQCNHLGNCNCLENVEGKHCDYCKENTFDIVKSCVPCPLCYNFVQTEMRSFLKELSIMMEKIRIIEDNFPYYVHKYQKFVQQILSLKDNVEKLKQTYVENSSSVSIKLLQELSQESEDLNKKVNEMLTIANNFSYTTLKKHLYYVYSNLSETENLVNVCQEALDNATLVAKTISRYNRTITNIAKDAIATAQRIEDRVNQFSNESLDETLLICNETCQLQEMVLEINKQILNEVSLLKSGIENSSRGMSDMKTYLEDLHNKTLIAKDNALINLNQIKAFEIPNSSSLLVSFEKTKQDVFESSEIVKNISEILEVVEEKSNLLSTTLNTTENKERALNENLFNIHLLKNRSDSALERVEKLKLIIELAENNLSDLEKFNNTMLTEISKIQNKIDAVLNNSEEIKEMFITLNSTITFIKEAEENVTKISKNITSNAELVELNLKIVTELEQQQIALSETLEEETVQLSNIRQSLDELNQSQMKYENDLELMKEYLIILEALPTSHRELHKIEREIKRMEDMMKTVESVRVQKEQLQKEVDNVREIIESLPEEVDTLCKAVEIEPKFTEDVTPS